VHNTDSNYVFFPHLNTAVEIWDHSLRVAKEVSSLFPKPLNLEFESVIYWRFFIITKKRYMYTECNRDGQVGTKVGKKGVLLARRDNSLFVRRLYEAVIMRIFDKEDMLEVYLLIVREITKLLSHCCSYSDFVVTKAVGDTGDYRDIASFTEISKNKGGKDLSTPKFKIGDYTVSKIGDCKNAAKKNSAVDEADFYLKSLPGQVQLAERLRRRGQRVEAGSRIEYVVTNNGGHSAALATKMESYDYFVKFSGVLNIDYLYYLKAIVNPLDQLLNIAYGGSVRTGAKPHRFFQKNFVLKQYKLRVAHDEMIREIKSFSEPKFIVSAGNSNRLL
jgi:DNA polymerase elongation subunit (family B)